MIPFSSCLIQFLRDRFISACQIHGLMRHTRQKRRGCCQMQQGVQKVSFTENGGTLC